MAGSESERASALTRFFDYATLPAFVGSAMLATYILLERIPHILVTSVVVGTLAVIVAIVERARPERRDHVELDQPLLVDAAHYFLNYNLGYALALGACAAVDYGMKTYVRVSLWPTSWPLPVQLVLAAFLGEVLSYWQHRLSHRIQWLWRFHALHHSGARLNLLRAGRFHFVDFAPGAFWTLVPFVLLGAPDTLLIWIACITGILGVSDHSNMRMRTPAWLDRIICTPAVHRHHHSRVFRESDRNFGTSVMLYDVLFGSYEKPRADGPLAVGIEDDPVPRGFWKQFISPFFRERSNVRAGGLP